MLCRGLTQLLLKLGNRCRVIQTRFLDCFECILSKRLQLI